MLGSATVVVVATEHRFNTDVAACFLLGNSASDWLVARNCWFLQLWRGRHHFAERNLGFRMAVLMMYWTASISFAIDSSAVTTTRLVASKRFAVVSTSSRLVRVERKHLQKRHQKDSKRQFKHLFRINSTINCDAGAIVVLKLEVVKCRMNLRFQIGFSLLELIHDH